MKELENCKSLVSRDEKVMSPASRISYFPLVVSRADGSKIWDLDGNEYIDFLSGAAVTNIGHRHPQVVEAVREQLEKFIHNTLAYTYYQIAVELAEKLVEITPGRFPKRVAFGLSGSDANDGAIKLARSARKRPKIISFLGSYHGSTLGALSLSGISLSMRRSLGPLVPEIHHVPYPDCYRCYVGLEFPECDLGCVEFLRTTFKTIVPPDEVAALILEPIQGDAGVVIPPNTFWKSLRGLCDEYGILLVDEEVQTGLGRTGKMFAIEHWGVEPDIVLTAKAIASGLPLSAIVSKAELMENWPPPAHLFTTQASPLSCAAALATIDVLMRDRLPVRADRLGVITLKRFEEMMEEHRLIGDVRGKGLLIGVDLVSDSKSKAPARKEALKTCWRAYEKGLVMISFGRFGNVLRIAPSLTISEEELETGLGIIEESIGDVEKGRVPDDAIRHMKGW